MGAEHSSIPGIWFKVFTIYQKDPRLLGEWINIIRKDPVKALETARRLVDAEVVPDTLTLGFSPQILVAILSINYPGKVKVITSPEVVNGSIPAAKHSSEALKIFEEIGLIEEIITTSMTPAPNRSPREVLDGIRNAVRRANPRIIDISGGTQLVALAVAGEKLGISYTYPEGRIVRIYRIL